MFGKFCQRFKRRHWLYYSKEKVFLIDFTAKKSIANVINQLF